MRVGMFTIAANVLLVWGIYTDSKKGKRDGGETMTSLWKTMAILFRCLFSLWSSFPDDITECALEPKGTYW